MFSIADKLENVSSRIQKATNSAGRAPGSVKLLPVSKKHGAKAVLEAFKCGCLEFGENYVSEAVDKQSAVLALDEKAARQVVWHFIGPVQSNKTRTIAEHFDWVQSVDRAKIARRLSEQRPASLEPLNICIQINIDAEDTKSGIALDELADLASLIASLPQLRLRGLMAIPSASATSDELGTSMQRLQKAFLDLQLQYDSVDTLSMGMSSDLELAIAHGSTMVRVGTDIFGART